MNFQENKQKQLSKIDKSHIGSWDVKIKELCEKLNKSKNYYTTSSCSGRVVLLKASDSKIKDVFLFRSHREIGLRELKRALGGIGRKYKGVVEFQQTPCILHVACSSLSDAFKIVGMAKLAGWKRSGVMSDKRNMVELNSTENMSFPVLIEGEILVDDEFLKLVVEIANSKLERVWEKIERLRELL